MQKLWSIPKNSWNIDKKNDLDRFPLFFGQNVDRSYIVRQQAIALIFLLMIEDIKVYHLGYLKEFASRKSIALLAKFIYTP